MIRFSCRCTNVIEAPDDQAGLPLQCPKCGVLVDVPTYSDRDAIQADGTYKFEADEQPPSPDGLKKLTTVYFPGRYTPQGEEIDLRGPVEGFENPDIPLAEAPKPADRPRYDPETGELIKPLEVQVPQDRPADPATLPVAQRVHNYSVSAENIETVAAGWQILAELFKPVNLFVMGMVLLFHCSLLLALLVTVNIFFVFPAPLIILALLVGHYALVVEETGPGERDELPRPLRNMELYDDYFAPFASMMASLMFCYWPLVFMWVQNTVAVFQRRPLPYPAIMEFSLGFYLLGSIFFPAVFLIVTTSGSAFANLRPDRIVGTMLKMGWTYPMLVVLWLFATAVYSTGQVGQVLHVESWFRSSSTLLGSTFIAYPLLMLGVYLTHAFCWYLGRQYRARHAEFPWVGQRHVRKTPAASGFPIKPIPTAKRADAATPSHLKREIR